MNWRENFIQDQEIILATSSKENLPNAIIVISLGFIDQKLLIADCQMSTTIENLKENSNICVIGGYFRIKGITQIFSSGKYFDLCVESTPKYKVKNAILIEIQEVSDLDQVKKVVIDRDELNPSPRIIKSN